MRNRNNSLGGSEIAAICGLSKWQTPYQVWARKVGLEEDQADSQSLQYGRLIEPVIRQWYAEHTGESVIVPNVMRHPVYHFLTASLDGITSHKRVLEIKTSRSADDWGDPGTDQIPVYYQTQVQQYMLISGLSCADVAVSIFGQLPQIYTIEADRELQDMLVERAVAFWKLVETRTPPEAVSYADVISKFGNRSMAGSVLASVGAMDSIRELRSIRIQLKSLEKQEEILKTDIMKELGTVETMTDIDGRIVATWKAPKLSQAFDLKRFAEEHPDLHKQYCVEKASSRRFLLK